MNDYGDCDGYDNDGDDGDGEGYDEDGDDDDDDAESDNNVGYNGRYCNHHHHHGQPSTWSSLPPSTFGFNACAQLPGRGSAPPRSLHRLQCNADDDGGDEKP